MAWGGLIVTETVRQPLAAMKWFPRQGRDHMLIRNAILCLSPGLRREKTKPVDTVVGMAAEAGWSGSPHKLQGLGLNWTGRWKSSRWWPVLPDKGAGVDREQDRSWPERAGPALLIPDAADHSSKTFPYQYIENPKTGI